MKHANGAAALVARLTPATALEDQRGGRALKLGLLRRADGSLDIYDGADLRSDLAKAVHGLVRKASLRLGHPFSTLADWHTDEGVHAALAFGLGHHGGGHLELQGRPPDDLQGRDLVFDGRVLQRSHPPEGHRCLVAATLSADLADISSSF